MITFIPTRNIDLIEMVGNHPDIIAGSNNGDGYDYKPECRYFEVNVHGQFGGIVYYNEIQPLTFDCHAMYLPEIRGFSKEIGPRSGDIFSPIPPFSALHHLLHANFATVRCTAQ